jgi:ectoine hydroxylase-related dioxygenase (phytanoyl-CoA dioxygenase family)
LEKSFFITRSANKYKNNNLKNPGQKIRTGDIVVAVFVLYRCAVDASTLHAARHDTTGLQRRPTFSIFFSAKGGRVRTKEKIRV